MTSLSAEQTLTAIDQIHSLKARYFRLLDDHDWAGVSALFTSDAVLKVPLWSAPETRDPAMVLFAATMDPLESIHAGFLPVITVESEISAEGTWQMEDRLYRPIDGSSDEYSLVHGFGRYFDRYTKVAERWLFSGMELVRTRKDFYPRVRKVIDAPPSPTGA